MVDKTNQASLQIKVHSSMMPPEPGGDDVDFNATTVTAAPLAAVPEPAAAAYLLVMSGPRAGQSLAITDELLIGRDENADLPLGDPGASRRHASVVRTLSGRILIRDLRSINGTYLNGHRIGRSYLSDGDQLRIGRETILRFAEVVPVVESVTDDVFGRFDRDPLTGLHTRKWLSRFLEEDETQTEKKKSLNVCVFGWDAPDGMTDHHINAIARHFMRRTRVEDAVARIGYARFAICLVDVPPVLALGICGRLQASFSELPVYREDPHWKSTISAGIACSVSVRKSNLLTGAEDALARAQAAGGGRLQRYEADETNRASAWQTY